MRKVKKVRAVVFDGAVHGNIGYHNALEIQNWKYEFHGIISSTGILVAINQGIASPNRSGFAIESRGGAVLRLNMHTSGLTQEFITSTITFPIGADAEITVKKVGTQITFTVDESSDIKASVSSTIFYDNTAADTLLAADGGLSPRLFLNGKQSFSRLTELNGSGVEINELWNYDIKNGDINSISNIGADAPASSDAIAVPAGDWVYENI